MKLNKYEHVSRVFGGHLFLIAVICLVFLVGIELDRALISSHPFVNRFNSIGSINLSIQNYLKGMICLFWLSLILSVIYLIKRSSLIRLYEYLVIVIGGSILQYLALQGASFLIIKMPMPQELLIEMSIFNSFSSVLILVIIRLFREKSVEEVVRGVRKIVFNKKVVLRKYARKSMKSKDDYGIKIWCNCYIPRSYEAQHILILGSTGSGKTQIMYPLIKQAIQRGDNTYIWDLKGIYTQAINSRGEIYLFAPWDERSLCWDISKDILTQADCYEVANILVKDDINQTQKFFPDAARSIIELVFLDLLAKDESWTWKSFYDYFTNGKKGLIEKISLSDIERAPLEVLNDKTKSSDDVFSTLLAAVTPLRPIVKAWGQSEGVSLRPFVEGDGFTLIFGGCPKFQTLSRKVFELSQYFLINEILSLPDNDRKRRWMFMDEMAALGKSECIQSALNMGRSKGLSCVVGIQDLGQIEHIYGRSIAQSISNSFLTRIVLRCSDPATSKWAAEVIGEQEIAQKISSSSQTNRNIKTKSSQIVYRTQPVFMPSEIANFDALEGVIKISGWPVAKVNWKYQEIPQLRVAVIEADWVNEKPKVAKKEDDAQVENKWRLD